MKERLGAEYLEQIHVHMYPVEYNSRGEKVHRAFDDRIDLPLQLSAFQDTHLIDSFSQGQKILYHQ